MLLQWLKTNMHKGVTASYFVSIILSLHFLILTVRRFVISEPISKEAWLLYNRNVKESVMIV